MRENCRAGGPPAVSERDRSTLASSLSANRPVTAGGPPALQSGWLIIVLLWGNCLFLPGLAAQGPPPAPPPAASTPPPATNPIASPTPPAGRDALVDALSPGELQEAINLLRANYIRPADVDDRSLARATLAGLLTRLDNGAMLLPKPAGPNATPPPEQLPDFFQSEILGERVGYVRFGALTRDHLAAFDRAVKDFNDKSVAALVLDLRATAVSSDYDLAADVTRRLVAKGKPLFTLRKPSSNQERLFTSNADPAYTGPVLLAVDGNTAGAAETIAAAVRYYDRSLVVGANTAGQAVEYADLRLSGGNLLRVAVSQVLLPGNVSIFPQGVKPDVPIRLPRADLLAILRGSLDKDHGGMAQFVLETERPHFNEAALVSGVNPELDAAANAQAARRRGDPAPKPPLRDPVVQRALDLATTLLVLDPKP